MREGCEMLRGFRVDVSFCILFDWTNLPASCADFWKTGDASGSSILRRVMNSCQFEN